MYKLFIRPLLFLIDPERVHFLIVKSLKIIFKIPGVSYIFQTIYCKSNNNLQTEFLGIKLKNPVGLAAGFDKDAKIFKEFSNLGFSHIEIGTVTPKAQPGNSKPRIYRLPKDKALINRMGLNNLGVDHAIERLKGRDPKIIIGGNIGKNTSTAKENAVNDYAYCFSKLYEYVDYFTINISCPNVHNMSDLQDKESIEEILKRLVEIRKVQKVYKPILIKISPDWNVGLIDDSIEATISIGTDGFVISNTTIDRSNLITKDQIVKKIGNGGLSGKPLNQKSTELIRYVSEKTKGKYAIIGVGGIMSEKEALEKLKAGATLLQIYTGFIYEGPGFVKKLNKAILKYRLKE